MTEFVNAASGVDDLLCARVKRVAFRTDFDAQRGLRHRGACLEAVAATASYDDFVVIRMDVGFHFSSLRVIDAVRGYKLGRALSINGRGCANICAASAPENQPMDFNRCSNASMGTGLLI